MVNVSMFLKDIRKTPPEGVWVDHPEDGYSIKARPLYPWKNTQLRQAASENGQVNENIYSSMYVDWVVEDWKGIVDDVGNKVPCNSENRILLFNNWVSFNVFVKETGIHLERQYKKDREKN